MLTVTHGRQITRQHIFIYTFLLAILGGATTLSNLGGSIYLFSTVSLNCIFLYNASKILWRTEEDCELDSFLVERKFFKFSLIYLFALFVAILVDSAFSRFALGFWI